MNRVPRQGLATVLLAFACLAALLAAPPVPGASAQTDVTQNEDAQNERVDESEPIAIQAAGTCALLSDGGVACWGPNGSGQAGKPGWQISYGPASWVSVPNRIPGIDDAVAIDFGGAHGCALLATGQVACWGSDRYGQLGDGGAPDDYSAGRHWAEVVPGIEDAVRIFVDQRRSCAVLASGPLLCWGDNYSGTLGDGTLTNRTVPTLIPGLTDVVALSAGFDSHRCAVESSGAVKCWGTNSWGELGDGTTNPRLTPTVAVDITDAIAVQTGSTHTCALTGDGTVKCWGGNGNGQLGTGNNLTRLRPTTVTGLDPVVSLTLSSGQVCVADVQADVYCWGGLATRPVRQDNLSEAISVEFGLSTVSYQSSSDICITTTAEEFVCRNTTTGQESERLGCWLDTGAVICAGDPRAIPRGLGNRLVDTAAAPVDLSGGGLGAVAYRHPDGTVSVHREQSAGIWEHLTDLDICASELGNTNAAGGSVNAIECDTNQALVAFGDSENEWGEQRWIGCADAIAAGGPTITIGCNGGVVFARNLTYAPRYYQTPPDWTRRGGCADDIASAWVFDRANWRTEFIAAIACGSKQVFTNISPAPTSTDESFAAPSWSPLGGCAEDVAVAAEGDRVVIVAIGCGSQQVFMRTADNYVWSPWTSIGGCLDEIALVVTDDGAFNAMGTGCGGGVPFVSTMAPGEDTFDPWERIGGCIDAPAFSAIAGARLTVLGLACGTNNLVFQTQLVPHGPFS